MHDEDRVRTGDEWPANSYIAIFPLEISHHIVGFSLFNGIHTNASHSFRSYTFICCAANSYGFRAAHASTVHRRLPPATGYKIHTHKLHVYRLIVINYI